ncbi:hypothetical protein [Paenibacillus peoriae]|uniref:hypothetical protein n=1 Tax=Paenibacillus peoriae TaxID=59893 RepID=UPI00096D2C3B|nr:hypothetical protein [Paenibacillus peoriae]OMF32305.1 hypothetical protein BK134_10770 [Paenibacillus peoriae]
MKANIVDFKKKVPSDRVKYVIDKEEIDCKKTSIDVMFKGLEEKQPQTLEDIYAQYQYAGKTAVNIFECVEFPSTLNTKENFLVHLKAKLNKETGMFSRDFRPEITTVPRINRVEDLGDAVLLQWVSGESKEVRDGYNIVQRISPTFEYMMIRFGNPVFIELRCGYSTHRKYKDAFKDLLSSDAADAPPIVWMPVTKVTEAEAEKISEKLNAGLVESEVVGEGCIGRLSVLAAPGIEDLKQQEQYKDMVAGRQYLAQVFHIDYTETDTGYSTKVKFRINLKGGFEFKSKVSERIIRRILDVFVEVRYGLEEDSEEDIQEPAS